MALHSGGMVVPDNVPVQWYGGNQLLPPYYQADEREGFLMWLRGEFAAANAIIDSLCHHLRAVGDPREYDEVIGSIQQRRCYWSPILYLQQYFSVADVVYALQHACWRRDNRRAAGLEGSDRVGGGGKDSKRGGRWPRGGNGAHNSGWEVNGKDLNNVYAKRNLCATEKPEEEDRANAEEKEDEKDINEKFDADSIMKKKGCAQEVVTHADDKAWNAESCHVDGAKIVSPRTFVANEICEGKLVNVGEGLRLYDDIFDEAEISKLGILVNELRASGKRGQLKGQAFTTQRRPMRGHGREIIQLGVPIAGENTDNEGVAPTSRDTKSEPIPELLQDIIQRLLTKEVVSVKPDSAVVDVFNEGDYSQPHMWSQLFGRPVCLLFLTECEMCFSKVITVNHPGDFRGALKLSLSPGSILVLQGKATDLARHAISSQWKQRILITLTKSQRKKLNADAQRFLPTPPPMHTTPAPCPPPGQRIFVSGHVKPTTGVFPPPLLQVPGWPVGPQLRHSPPPCLPVPGTGVFIPPHGSGNESGQQPSSTENLGIETIIVSGSGSASNQHTSSTRNIGTETTVVGANENGLMKEIK